ncbi:MAG: hypothetical protein WCK33_08300 [Phycisphaerae bacterium]
MKTLAALAALAVAGTAFAGPITNGNLVVYRVGTGSGTLVNTGNAVFLDEYTPAGTLVQSIAMPTTVSGSNKQLIASGTASSEGFLSVSTDGRYITLTGYAANLGGTSSLSTSTGARTVGIFEVATGTIDTSTALTDFAPSNNPRSAVTTNGTDLWVAGGSGGVRYATKGATTSTQLATSLTNIRQVNLFGGQLYVSSGSGTNTFRGISTVGSGIPTASGQTITRLAGLSDTANASSYAFFLADLSDSVPGVDTMYVADDSSTVGGIQKFSLVGSSWVANGTLGTAADLYRGLTAAVTQSGVQLFATRKGGSTAAGGGELVSLLDASGYNATISGSITLVATAGSNTAFRGVGYVVPAPGSIALLAMGGLVATRRRR